MKGKARKASSEDLAQKAPEEEGRGLPQGGRAAPFHQCGMGLENKLAKMEAKLNPDDAAAAKERRRQEQEEVRSVCGSVLAPLPPPCE